MANYLLLYRGGKAPEGEQARKKSMEDWDNWFKGLGDKVVYLGNPCHAGKSVSSSGVSDNELPNAISGYTVVKADNEDAAIELVKTCPIQGDGGTVEVHECFEVM